MRGQIQSYDAAQGEGRISGGHSSTYPFVAIDVVSGQPLKAGQQVDFRASPDGRAQKIVVIAQPSTSTGAGKFNIGRVIKRTFASVAKNWAVFFGGTVVLVGLPTIVTAWGLPVLLSGERAPSPLSMAGIYIGVGVLTMTSFYVMQGLVLTTAIEGFNGKSANIQSAVSVGFSRFLPLLAVAILMSLGLVIGFLFLIIPGLIYTVLWAVAAPVVVVERQSVFGSFQRSADLTAGHRWQVFALFLIYWLMAILFAMAIGRVGMHLSGGSPWAASLAKFVGDVISSVFAAAGAASLYYELRTAKEGIGADDLAAIFD